MLVDFSYHPQIHDWVWIYFYLKEENAWDIIMELTKVYFFLDFFFFKYCLFSGPPWRHSLSDTGKQMYRGDVNSEF